MKIILALLFNGLILTNTYCQNNTNENYLFVTAKSGLKLRNAPNLTSKVIEVVKFSNAVQPIGMIPKNQENNNEDNSWIKVNYRGKIGYMSFKYLSKLPRIDLQLLRIQPDFEYPISALSNYFHITLVEIENKSKKTIRGCEKDPDCKNGVFETTHYLNKGFKLIKTQSWDSFDEEIIGINWSFRDAKDLVDWILNPMWEGKYNIKSEKDSIIYQNDTQDYSIKIKKINQNTISIRWETSH